MERVDAVVAGSGVIGLAIGRALAAAGLETLVLEAEPQSGTSSRNSEVIHAGLYYPTGSLKAQACVAGRHALYEFCARHGVAHRRCGKLIVATDGSQLPRLDALQAKALANGVEDLQPLTAADVRRREPDLACAGALLSPSTGIIDSHGLMLALLGDMEDRGGLLARASPLEAAAVTGEGFVLRIGGAEPMSLACRLLVNAAGLGAQALAARIDGLDPATIPPLRLAKGNYYALTGRTPFQHLVYPLPEPGGLGVHLTLDLAGQGRFGPDVEWVAAVDYRVDPAGADRFHAAIRRYWPGLPDQALTPAYAGIRPKLVGPGEADADFCLHGPDRHGVPGLFCLYGIESPGLTACLDLARRVVAGLVDQAA